MQMFCNQCEMSVPGGCGSKGRDIGTCGKDANLTRLQDVMVYGLKGLAAYREHARQLGAPTQEVDDVIADSLYFTMTNVNFNFGEHIAQLMKIGQAGVTSMNLLSEAHTKRLGVPTPVKVSQNHAEGHGILVSGHNLDMLQKLLQDTEGKGINVYTHSEMLPAHAYPELKKFSHLKGNIGKAWHDQGKLFNHWPGTLVVNTNCIVPPEVGSHYLDRLFTYKNVGVEGAHKIENDDFSALIAKTLASPKITGFDSEETLVTGHHYQTVLTLAPQILEAVTAGKIKKFFVIAGCDAPGKPGEYYRELALSLPKNCVVVTSSCGKFRFNDHDFGKVPGTEIPRYLDLGQCNDSNGAVHIALALSGATGLPVNELPIKIVLSWMEQKAVIILLALFSLGIQNITIGPKPPQFVNQDIMDFLVQQFNLSLTGEAKDDLKAFLAA
ncbi:MAG: hydroxylamine reductase [Candidatus Lambdaproteobacteria bacterium RIFOXYD1_FULL_56_27]|uniref:Hydroxylamine reductase n=1 Tax=Candidatus Lambdaproteobacteria bacterium RIFOXYD2_FULL_56_26 TaxID=1817773 RepID=A0A1F6H3I5_9PROT|nr:MAG: hydroxylamine reductase [Candidatus Lambdaproteobacteria bacterium RIFOXYC1_FULL_56_13]OGH04864.1 MAG: hydroxylamine reductase [Candidatus Lambdaproteobacteria bacterium RIFOXYD2_FULL_56_26]OGH09329.1 MAG: hydroxylamine reductase [Candidatus Lambdaproteobacteria bacterium RIFOXYD1_FULL_56_27]